MGLLTKSHLGLSIRSDQLLNISTFIGNAAVKQFEKEKLYAPFKLKQNFTIAAVDNIDVNPASAATRSSFQGTGTS